MLAVGVCEVLRFGKRARGLREHREPLRVDLGRGIEAVADVEENDLGIIETGFFDVLVILDFSEAGPLAVQFLSVYDSRSAASLPSRENNTSGGLLLRVSDKGRRCRPMACALAFTEARVVGAPCRHRHRKPRGTVVDPCPLPPLPRFTPAH